MAPGRARGGRPGAWAVAAALALGQGAVAQPVTPPSTPEPPQDPPQVQPQEDPYDGRLIRAIVIEAVGPDGKPLTLEPQLEQLARNQLLSAVGLPYRRQAVLDEISKLNRIGQFRQVTSRVTLQADGSVVLTFTVAPQAIVQDVQVVGNTVVSDQELLGAAGELLGAPIDRFRITRGASRIEALYRQRGHYRVRATVDEKALAESSIVLYRIVEGERLKVTDIRFEGNHSIAAAELRPQLQTKEASWLFEKGALDDDLLATDVATLAQYYREHGYLDARVDKLVQPAPNGREAIVTFVVAEGPLYHLRSIRAQLGTPGGAGRLAATNNPPTQFTSEQLAALMPIKPGDVYGGAKLRDGLRAIVEAYGALGYADAYVDRFEVRGDATEPEVDLLLLINEGRAFRTGEILIQGNSRTKQKVIRRAMLVSPERPLDASALEESRQRLEDLRIFYPRSVKLVMQAHDEAEPEHRDVLVEVEETNTGEFNIGAALSSDLGVTGTVQIKERNFDVARLPSSFDDLINGDAFRGAGQTFSIDVAPGTQTQTYAISLLEPHLLESDYSGSARIGYAKQEFDPYDQERYGGAAALGRAFGTRWIGTMRARYEWVNISGVDDDSPQDFFDVEGTDRITGVALEFSRTTTDRRFDPTSGSRLELGLEQVGLLGGDFNFSKLKLEYTLFLPVAQSAEGYATVLSLSTRMNYIPQGSDEAPMYERYYLGGQNFRGFDYRAIAPIGVRPDGTMSDEPVGGSWSFFQNIEVQQPIYRDIVRIVGFIDTGTVVDQIGFEDYRVSVGFGFRVSLAGLSPVPLAFDLGFPLMSEESDAERVFTFFIDLPY